MSTGELDFSKPEELQTRDGRSVRIYCTDGGGEYPVHGAVDNGHGAWFLRYWKLSGVSVTCATCDLVRKPRRVTGWLNVYGNGRIGPHFGKLYSSQRDAKLVATDGCVGQIFVDAELEVGE